MDYDVIIVGARIAGSVLATLLGERGHRVLVLDRSQFPSDTLSTHFFRAPAMQVFERLGALEAVKAEAPAMARLWNYIDGHVIEEPVEGSPEHLRFFLCLRRIKLDWILFQSMAPQSTLEIHQGAQVKGLIRENGSVAGVHWIEAGQACQASARAVVGADGFYSTVSKLVEPAFENRYPVQRCMYFAYFNGLEPLEPGSFIAEHHFVGDSLTYVFPTDSQLTLIALSLPIGRFQAFKKEPLKNLLEHLKSLPRLQPRLKHAEPAGEVKGSGNIPGYQRKPYGPGWALAGDAQQIVDPWSGMGIDHATTHAAMLADSLHSWLAGEAGWEAAMSDYHTRIRSWSAKTYKRTCTHAADFQPMTHAALAKRGLI